MITLVFVAIGCCATAPEGRSRGCRGEEDEFTNVHSFKKPGLIDFIKWRLNRLSLNLPDPERYSFPIASNDPAYLRSNRKETTITWIGHSTLFLQVGGVNILTDPHFSDRASPLQWIGPKRVTPPGILLDDLPAVDMVLISHNHYDHLDADSIERLHARPGGRDTIFFIPCGLKEWFAKRGIEHIVEMNWGEDYGDGGIKILCVPMHHWSKRSLLSENESLWAGWIVEKNGFRFLFIGDTGYSPVYKEIGRTWGPFDLAALPIGAYEPRWFMKHQHVTPEEALQIHKDVRAKKSIATHWGTFVLTDESLDEPPRRLMEQRKVLGIPDHEFVVPMHGETLIFDETGK